MVGGLEPGGWTDLAALPGARDEPLSGSSGGREPSIDARHARATRSSGRSSREAERTADGAPVGGARDGVQPLADPAGRRMRPEAAGRRPDVQDAEDDLGCAALTANDPAPQKSTARRW